MAKKTYQERKEAARQEAVDWQIWLSENSISGEGLMIAAAHFEATGRRYGLLQEFRENAVL